MDISKFEEADRSAVVSLWKRCDLTRPWNNPDSDIDRKVAHSPDTFWLGRKGGVLMASVMFGYDGHRGSVNYLAVDPDFQGQGYGRQLMGEVEKMLRLSGCPKINLAIRTTNHGVMAFYRQLGYELDSVSSLGKRFAVDNVR